MSQEQDRDLAAWLGDYQVDDLSPRTQDALLNSIVATAEKTPRRPTTFSRGFVAQAMGLVAAGVLGFYVGSVNSVSTTVSVATTTAVVAQVQTTSTQQASSASATYFDREVFGAKTWKEVSL